MSANAVTPVILGLLSMGRCSGYEIKASVDRSTRFFWAGSYGQIYPELRRLEAEGLVEGEDLPNGRRARRVYSLTPAGHGALRDWLLGSDYTVELRDESLLRLFFADVLPHAEALGLLEVRRRGHQEYLQVLRAIAEGAGGDPQFMSLVVRWGIDFHEWGAQWCTEQLERLTRATTAA